MSKILENMDLSITFFRAKNSDKYWKKYLKEVMFSSKTNETEIFKSILQTNVGNRFSGYEHDSFSTIDRKIFKNFKIRHNLVKYSLVFKQNVPSKRESYFKKSRKINGEFLAPVEERSKCNDQVHPKQIKEGFQIILYKVFTQELIGNSKNKKLVLKNLEKLLLTAKTENITLLKLLKQLDVCIFLI